MTKLKVGDFIKITALVGQTVSEHLSVGMEYEVEYVCCHAGGSAFRTNGGRCRDQSCQCNGMGWYLTSEFEIVQKLSEDEMKSAKNLPTASEVADYFGIKI